MPRTTVITDSSACLPVQLVGQLGLFVVPLAVLFDGRSFRDGEIDRSKFAERLRMTSEYPTTAAPAPGEFLDAFRRAGAEGAESVLCLTLSSHYSSTYDSALQAKALAERELAALRVQVLDTGGIAMTHGFAVLDAARAAANGASLEDAEAAVRRAAVGSHLVGMLDGTRYLAKSGRVPRLLHVAASALGIKPIIASTHGKIGAAGRVRTTEQGVEKLVQFVRERTVRGAPLRIAIMHAAAAGPALRLTERVREALQPDDLLETEFTPAMMVHTGPGFIGLAWQTPEQVPEPVPRTSLGLPRQPDVATLAKALGPLPGAVACPPLVLLSGLPGSGKSHLAREIAARYPIAVLNSDLLRKALVKRPVYSQRESARLFAAIHILIEDLLHRGIPALLDATNLKEAHRRPVFDIAERTGARLLVIDVRAPEVAIRKRLSSRQAGANPTDPSEATVKVYEMMRREAEPIERPHLVVDTTGDIGEAVTRIIGELREVPA